MTELAGFALIPVVIAGVTIAVFQYRARAQRKLAQSKRSIFVPVQARDGASERS